eukprot:872850-Prymnesium_polylepis.1
MAYQAGYGAGRPSLLPGLLQWPGACRPAAMHQWPTKPGLEQHGHPCSPPCSNRLPSRAWSRTAVPAPRPAPMPYQAGLPAPRPARMAYQAGLIAGRPSLCSRPGSNGLTEWPTKQALEQDDRPCSPPCSNRLPSRAWSRTA